ncbi:MULTISPECIES: thioester domain-containing protein [Clostridium]|uniref:Thioester domain-containing protein n=1 Tax=Clostridium sartagoforme AAU1 TaxID=1202534 RepID=R9CE44_9CLOT|nr:MULTISPECIES: thioester domain-containing protein [Clostridium]EOR27543.1 hypothetical protein A500_04046 [Clostridium sartagoforme AAU1]KLE15855.1 TQXA domain-containing protein [Clostridium sp. C8]
MKFKRKSIAIVFILVLLILNFSSNYFAMQLGDEVKISTGDYYVGEIEYENFIIKAKMIRALETEEIGYCLEIEKLYPSGEIFKGIGYATDGLAGIISEGYPNKSYGEIGLSSEEEAYFATQIAIWSYVEGYDINGFKGNNRVVEAIKKIYNQGISKNSEEYNNQYKIYNYNDEVQDIALIKNYRSEIIEENSSKLTQENSSALDENQQSIIYGK